MKLMNMENIAIKQFLFLKWLTLFGLIIRHEELQQFTWQSAQQEIKELLVFRRAKNLFSNQKIENIRKFLNKITGLEFLNDTIKYDTFMNNIKIRNKYEKFFFINSNKCEVAIILKISCQNPVLFITAFVYY